MILGEHTWLKWEIGDKTRTMRFYWMVSVVSTLLSKRMCIDQVRLSCNQLVQSLTYPGINFPAYAFENQAETEGFAKMAKRAGYEVYGLPNYVVWHIDTDEKPGNA